MPNHPPKTLSYKDAKFIEETLKNCQIDIRSTVVYMQVHGMNRSDYILDDIDRCIKILESEDE